MKLFRLKILQLPVGGTAAVITVGAVILVLVLVETIEDDIPPIFEF